MDITKQKKKAIAYLVAALTPIDKLSDVKNVDRYESLLEAMSDVQFDKFMKSLRDKKTCIHIYLPNMTKRPSIKNILDIAAEQGTSIFHRIKLFDETTGEYYLTNEKYPVFKIPVRRLQQFLDKKMSVPQGDTKTDGLTGQVAWEDKAATISNPEIQALQAKGLSISLHELVAVRGGNVEAWNGEMKQQAEESGVVYLDDVGNTSSTRTAIVAQTLLEGMLLDNNLVGD